MITGNDGAYFDSLVEAHGDFNPFTPRGWQTLRRRFEDASGRTRDLDVLDVGCGKGRSRQIYRGSARRYVGLDLSHTSVLAARRREPDATWLQADALQLPFAPNSFDLVAFSSVLHHVPDVEAALRAARSVLRPGGLVFAFDPNLLHPAMLLFRHPKSPLYRAEGVSPDEQPLHPRVLRDAFARAGLRNIGQRCQSDIPYRAVAPRLLNAVLPAYNAVDWVWERLGAGRMFGTFVVTWARKAQDQETGT